MLRRNFVIMAMMMSTMLATQSLGLNRASAQTPGQNPAQTTDLTINQFNEWWPWPSDNQHQDKKKAASVQKMPGLRLDSKSITVSGISAGAYMATQLQVAYSATFSGVGSIAGGPWNCSDGETWRAQTDCRSSAANINVPSLIDKLRSFERAKAVDALGNLKKARIYIYNSDTDAVVRPPMREKNIEFFEGLVPSANIKVEQNLRSAHGFPTSTYGVSCDRAQSPYLMKCNYDTAGELLKQMYPGVPLSKKQMETGSLMVVDQTEFADDDAFLASTGWLYVPSACRKAGANCRLHVALHGCLQAGENIDDLFVMYAGYNEWAEGSKIVVLYPQTRKSTMNPYACFDWFGYTGADYAVKSGPQMAAIKAMIDRLVGP